MLHRQAHPDLEQLMPHMPASTDTRQLVHHRQPGSLNIWLRPMLCLVGAVVCAYLYAVWKSSTSDDKLLCCSVLSIS